MLLSIARLAQRTPARSAKPQNLRSRPTALPIQEGLNWLSLAMKRTDSNPGRYVFIQRFRRFSSNVTHYESTEFDNMHGLRQEVLWGLSNLLVRLHRSCLDI